MCEVLTKDGQRAKFPLSSGQTVGDLVQKVALKFHYPPSSVRLFFSGRELKPSTAFLDRFEIGKYENFLIHLSTTTVEIYDGPVPSNSVCATVDLTGSTSAESLVDLTSTSPEIQERKKRRLISAIAPVNGEANISLHNVSNKQLRINMSRALNHRLCILENRILNHSSQSSMDNDISVEFLVHDPGVARTYFVKVHLDVSCQCENTTRAPCRHILFILLKVFRLSPDHCCFLQSSISFSRAQLHELFASKGYISTGDSGVMYCGSRAPLHSSHNAPSKITPPPPPRVQDEPDECSVCLRTLIVPPESFESGDELVSCRKCHNKLHQYCVQQWLQRSQTCPNCRFTWKISKKKTTNKTSSLVRSRAL